MCTARLGAALAGRVGLGGLVRLNQPSHINPVHGLAAVAFPYKELCGRPGCDAAAKRLEGCICCFNGEGGGGSHGCSRFVVEALASCPHILLALLPVSRGGCRIS